MKMTEPALSSVPAQRGLIRAACRQFASSPPTQRPVEQRDVQAPPPTAADATSRMSAAGSPTWRCSAEPDSRRRSAAADIATEDWDLLFRAALEFLARVAVEKAVPEGTGVRLQAPGIALRECMDALDQLRRSAPLNSTQQRCESVHTEGEITSMVPLR